MDFRITFPQNVPSRPSPTPYLNSRSSANGIMTPSVETPLPNFPDKSTNDIYGQPEFSSWRTLQGPYIQVPVEIDTKGDRTKGRGDRSPDFRIRSRSGRDFSISRDPVWPSSDTKWGLCFQVTFVSPEGLVGVETLSIRVLSVHFPVFNWVCPFSLSPLNTRRNSYSLRLSRPHHKKKKKVTSLSTSTH